MNDRPSSIGRMSSHELKPFFSRWFVYLISIEFIGVALVHFGQQTRFDFRLFYAAGYLVRTQPAHLYDLISQWRVEMLQSTNTNLLPFCHPPYEAVLYAPFSFLSYKTAYLAYIAINMLLLMAVFFASRRAFSSFIPIWQPQPGSMFFIFIPLLTAVMQGQDSILLLLICCLTWTQIESGKDVTAGCCLALALFKFQIAVPLAILLAATRGRRFVFGFLATSAAVVLLCVGIAGRSGIAALSKILVHSTSTSIITQKELAVAPLSMPTLEGLLSALGTRLLPSTPALLIVGACSLGLIAACAFVIRHKEPQVAFAIAMLCAMLVSYHLYAYDLTLLLLPIALLGRRGHKIILLASFGLPIVIFMLGASWYFLMALPVAAMLFHAACFIRRPNPTEQVPDSSNFRLLPA